MAPKKKLAPKKKAVNPDTMGAGQSTDADASATVYSPRSKSGPDEDWWLDHDPLMCACSPEDSVKDTRDIQFAPLVSGRVFLREIIRAIVHRVKCVLMCAPREGPSVRGSSEKCDLDRLASAGVNT